MFGPIAVIGMSAEFPMAADPAALWENLVRARDCVSGLPFARWGLTNGEDHKRPLYPHMGQLQDAEMFDPLFFSISPKEARLMDPQQRLFLQNCWRCIEDAGYAPSSLSGARVGVFAGCSGAGYGFGADVEATTHVLMGHSSAILPARIAYHLDLKGPCLAIDTACSSALVAISQACSSLASGDCDTALAGGVSVFASPQFSRYAEAGGMLSPDGRCHTFDHRANGFVPSEGVGVLLLKRLRDALRDGDRVQGVIAGWGVNHDGKTNGMTAPSVASQTALEKEVYDRFAIDPATITYVEAHGTGTRLGDPIEVQGLTDAFRAYTDREGYCALGSIKSNIGHTLAAAGVAGVVKTLLALRHRQLPPTINYEAQNPEASLAGGPFYVNSQLRPWTSEGAPLRAAVSSFSYSGTNAHIVLEAFQDDADPTPDFKNQEPCAIVLSARTTEQLAEQARRLLDHLEQSELSSSPTGLRDLAFTLQVGRDDMVERLGFCAASVADVMERLRQVLLGRSDADVARTNIKAAKRALDREGRDQTASRAAATAAALKADDQPALLAHWLAGAPVDWAQAYHGARPKRLGLPTYPFEKRRCWFSDRDEAEPRSGGDSEAAAVDARFQDLLQKLR